MVIQQEIESILSNALSPEYLSIENESDKHNVPPGSESHFKIALVSEAFESLRQVQRHQMIYKLLENQLAGGVHALALHTYSPQEWQDSPQFVPASPDCQGGSQKS
ncbi:BolA/IbaG family iron-sulfur metabolism protein [Aurantivibrio infirmus]